MSSSKEIPAVSFYSSRTVSSSINLRSISIRSISSVEIQRSRQAVVVTNGRVAKKKSFSPESKISVDFDRKTYRHCLASLVICLSDDEDQSQTKVKEDLEEKVESDDSNEEVLAQTSSLLVHRKDIVRIPESTIKRSDLLKKPFELGCSKVFFGLTEFTTDEEKISLRDADFEMKLESKTTSNRTEN